MNFFSENISLVTKAPSKKRLYVVNGLDAFCADSIDSTLYIEISTLLSLAIPTIKGAYFSVCSMSYAQRKEMYDRMYDEEGNMKVSKAGAFAIQAVPEWRSGQPGQMQGYAVAKVGDDYIVFTMNPGININGGKDLTQEQLAYLRETYDMDNLSRADRIKLLAELSRLGVISGNDAYAEAFPEKCPWARNQRRPIDSHEMDLAGWIEYYRQRAEQALAIMNNRIAAANQFGTVARKEPPISSIQHSPRS